MRRSAIAAMGAAAMTAAMPASAAIVLVKSSSDQGANVLFNDGGQTGATVTGHTQGGTLVDFTGTTVGGGTTIRADGGQARVEGIASPKKKNQTLLLSSLSFDLADGGTMSWVEFNLHGGNATKVDFTLFDQDGTLYSFTESLANGAAKFGFRGVDGASIRTVAMQFTGGVGDMRQVRLDRFVGGGSNEVPEPSTWALMILGFGAIGGAMRTRRARTAVRFV
jgi:hypothetical protein